MRACSSGVIRALVLEPHGGPLALGNQRPRQPVHVHAEVVQPAQVNVGRDSAQLQRTQQEFAGCLDDDARPQWSQCSVLEDGAPAGLVRALFRVQQCFDGLLPRARGDAVVAPCQIRFRDLQVEHGLPPGLIFRFDDLLCFLLVAGAQASAFAGGGVHAVVGVVAHATPDQAVSSLHGCHATAKIFGADSAKLASRGRVIAGYAKFFRSRETGVRFGVRSGPSSS